MDNSHGGKNLSKGLSQKWKERLKKLFFFALNNCSGDHDVLEQLLLNGHQHWLGNHENCGEFCKGGTSLDLSKEVHKKLNLKIDKRMRKVRNKSKEYAPNKSSSFIESINSAILTSCSKEKSFVKTY